MNIFYTTFMALEAVTMEVTVFWDSMPSYLYTATDVSQDRTIQKEGHNCGSM
jgi:hypothetical protein